jgi:hypothetical protein
MNFRQEMFASVDPIPIFYLESKRGSAQRVADRTEDLVEEFEVEFIWFTDYALTKARSRQKR